MSRWGGAGMLNDYGKELLKPWLSVSNAVSVTALIFVIALFKLTSSELASWVQAVGSIAAIWGALYVSNSQHRRQLLSEKKSSVNKAKARMAVVKNAAEYGLSVASFARKTPPAVVFITTWKMTLDVTTGAALKALEAIPVHELGTYELVVSYGGLLGGLVKIRAVTNTFLESGKFDDDHVFAAYNDIQLQGSLIEMYWEQFQRDFAKELLNLENPE